MKDERVEILKLRKEYMAVRGRVGDLETAFTTVGCRYRNDDRTCGHARNNIKKYPQHIPRAPGCSPGICPRN